MLRNLRAGKRYREAVAKDESALPQPPLLDLEVLKNRSFTVGTITASLAFFAFSSILVIMPLYIQTDRGYSATMSGLIMLPGAIGQCVSQFFGGRAMDRFGARPVALFGSIVLTLGTLGMSLVAMDTWIWWVSICQFIRQIGMGFLLMPITTWSLNCLNGPSEVSAGSSVTNTARQIAGAVGAPVLVILMETFAALHKQGGASAVAASIFRHSMGAANLRNNLSGNGVDGVLRRQGRRCRSHARHYFLARAARTACAAYGCELTADPTILNIIRSPGFHEPHPDCWTEEIQIR